MSARSVRFSTLLVGIGVLAWAAAPGRAAAEDLSVSSNVRGASIYLNGMDTGLKTPSTIVGLTPGLYQVTIQDDCNRGEASISVGAGLPTRASVLTTPTPGTVIVDAEPRSASIESDDHVPLQSGVPGELRCGAHTVRLTADGYIQAVVPVEVRAGAVTRVPVRMQELGMGTVELTVQPRSASITLDGKTVGSDAVTLPSVFQGEHVIGAEMDGYQTAARTITVEPGDALIYNIELRRSGASRKSTVTGGPSDQAATTTTTVEAPKPKNLPPAPEEQRRTATQRSAEEDAARKATAEAQKELEAERKARIEAERRASENEAADEAEKERIAEEAARKASEAAQKELEAERKARIEAERKADAESARLSEAEKKRIAEEAARKASEDAQKELEAERKAREGAEKKAAAERKAREEAERAAEAERQAREEAEAGAEAERKAREEAEAAAAAKEAEARRKSAALADAQKKASEAEKKAAAEAEKKAAADAEKKAAADAEKKAAADAKRRADEAAAEAERVAAEEEAERKAEAKRDAEEEASARKESAKRKAEADAAASAQAKKEAEEAEAEEAAARRQAAEDAAKRARLKKKKGGFSVADGVGVGMMGVGAVTGIGAIIAYAPATNAYEEWDAKVEAARISGDPSLDEAAASYHDDEYVPKVTAYYGLLGATPLLLGGGLVLVLVDDRLPLFVPTQGGGMLTWSGRF